MNREIFEKIGAILAAQVGLDPRELRPESSLESFGIDSFDLAEFSFHVEDEFGVNIDDYFSSHGTRATRISDLVQAVEAVSEQQRSTFVELGSASSALPA